MSNFEFLNEWPEIQENAQRAEAAVNADPRSSCFYSRYTLERTVHWMFNYDQWLNKPRYDDSLNTLINQRDFKDALGHSIFPKIKAVQKAGNNAVHSAAKVAPAISIQALKELHHILYWFYRTYTSTGTSDKPPQNQVFDVNKIPKTVQVDARLALQSTKQIKDLQKQIAARDEQREAEEQQHLKENETLRQQIAELQQQVTSQKAVNAQINEKVKDTHDYNEAETREFIIDQYLKEAGWLLTEARDREFPVTGMPISKTNPQGNGFVDYVLWGDDGKPLAVVEAKRTTRDAKEGKRQAELYADCLEQDSRFEGRRPLIYYTNGYDIWFWDDSNYRERQVQGFLSKDEMQRVIDRRQLSKPLADIDINTDIAGDKRPYQVQAIRAVCEQFDQNRQRKALLVMATGTGKTRTIIALVDVLMRAGWIKNALFLADRNALVSQAKKEFSRHLPKVSAEILSGGTGELKGRLYLSTYPTMMNLLSAPPETRLFGVGHFDLVIVDEAHRSVYKKYGYIFDYFDALLIGLTATPKSDLDRNTYDIFELPSNDPTFAYELQQAVDDDFLVPPKDVRVELGFVRKGIKYEKLSEEEKEEWESKEELEGRDEILPSEVNEFLFNKDTVVKTLDALMTYGIKVAGNDRLAKTIIFAANNNHAQFINDVFDENFPQYKGKFARVVTYKEKYAESLIDEFKGDRKPADPAIPFTIAISVDMLDTGIDVPEVCNLMFFKVVKSKVKFMQMIGRGTRLCPTLFGPNSPEDDKQCFKVIDCCQNFEYFDLQPEGAKNPQGKSLSESIFEKRLQLAQHLTQTAETGTFNEALGTYLIELMQSRVKGMNLDNFMVRPKRRIVEKYQNPAIWQDLDNEQVGEILKSLAPLPTEAEPLTPQEKEEELALRFDHLLLTMQLALSQGKGISDNQQSKLFNIARRLRAKTSIPAVNQHMEWIDYILTDNFWQELSLQDLEETRKRLRLLLQFIKTDAAPIVFTNFEDEVIEIKTNGGTYQSSPSSDLNLYYSRVKEYIHSHMDDLTIQRLHRNQPITNLDLEALEQKLFEASGIETEEEFRKSIHPYKSLGLFIRELVGMDRGAAKETFADYLDESRFNSQQIQFINTIIDYLTSNGIMNPEQLAQPPFSDIHFEGVFGVFNDDNVIEIRDRLKRVKDNADNLTGLQASE